MQSDRELLELAAKAAGITGEPSTTIGGWNCLVLPNWEGIWAPLDDDGDALRLAVMLNINHGNPGMRLSIDWSPADDPYAATRRAIVRAAAELAQAHPDHQDGGANA